MEETVHNFVSYFLLTNQLSLIHLIKLHYLADYFLGDIPTTLSLLFKINCTVESLNSLLYLLFLILTLIHFFFNKDNTLSKLEYSCNSKYKIMSEKAK